MKATGQRDEIKQQIKQLLLDGADEQEGPAQDKLYALSERLTYLEQGCFSLFREEGVTFSCGQLFGEEKMLCPYCQRQ